MNSQKVNLIKKIEANEEILKNLQTKIEAEQKTVAVLTAKLEAQKFALRHLKDQGEEN
jgi:hypothetical protein